MSQKLPKAEVVSSEGSGPGRLKQAVMLQNLCKPGGSHELSSVHDVPGETDENIAFVADIATVPETHESEVVIIL